MEKNISLGTYTSSNESHNNRNHYEEITLNVDHSFRYKARLGEFINIEKFGEWKLNHDTLILNEHKPEYAQVMSVTEQIDNLHPKGSIYFQVKDYDGDDLQFTVSASCKDTTLILRNNINHALLPLKKIEEFSISSTLLNYPKFVVKDSIANTFIIKVAPRRLLINEKWLIEGVNIRPKTTDDQYTGYYLSRKL